MIALVGIVVSSVSGNEARKEGTGPTQAEETGPTQAEEKSQISSARESSRNNAFLFPCKQRRKEKKRKRNVLSQATVKRIIQLGFLMYDVTRISTREISLACPWVLLTLAINPGKSQNDKSATSGPLICNETQ
ncbi:hypothetical protein K443DRAFT_674876 [Laccaria amethystina LaAM-08-1]|uniref:Uncharacterized protein n=1 Tax=Laccaria amethystina LaAM-08-1 TaxID=1095629 RepID=A0A0C9XL91_9AGAR|nr:hypothetical protein K443DRAFT_674876 [Laccaria amethystina LaAM-08-1]